MTPFYFGSRERRLFGVYHPAQGGKGNRAVLLCYPWGFEYVNSHRSMVRLATLLSQAGYHTLRFDYFGTGDSAGEDREADLEGARRDIATAIGELRDLSGADSVSIIGLRVGAFLGVLAAHDLPSSVDRIVLWDPVIDGTKYLEELYTLDDTLDFSGVSPASAFPDELGGGREVMGLPLTSHVASELSEIRLISAMSGLPHPTFAITTRGGPGQKELRAWMEAAGAGSTFEQIDDHPAWHEDWPDNAGIIPVSVIKRISSWMN